MGGQTQAGIVRARTNYIDWLRIIAVLLLIYFHSARIFNVGEAFYTKSQQTSLTLSAFIGILDVWHMHLFFLLSGAGTFFALGFRSRGQYAKERFKRIFIPFVFGTLVIIPPQGYYTLLRNPDFHLNYLQYLPQFFKIDPKTAGGYRGTFEWGHLWFILYLYVFSMLALPLFLYLRSEAGKKIIARIGQLMEKPGMIFLPLVPLGLFEVLLRPGWPSTHALFNDWANFVNYILFFIFGYLLCADPRFGNAIDRSLKYSAPGAAVAMFVYLAMYPLKLNAAPGYNPAFMAFIFFRSITTWFWILFLVGLGRKYLDQPSRFLPYLNQAAYPFYILHQTVIVIIGYYVLKLGMRMPIEYAIITTASLIGSLLIYDLCIKRWNPVRFLFGMKPKQ
jgi:peptidoglycan/LPS O-acetylase OafA/YrhL